MAKLSASRYAHQNEGRSIYVHTLGLQIHIAAHYCGYPAAVAVEYATTATSDTIHCNTVQLKYKLVHGVIFIRWAGSVELANNMPK